MSGRFRQGIKIQKLSIVFFSFYSSRVSQLFSNGSNILQSDLFGTIDTSFVLFEFQSMLFVQHPPFSAHLDKNYSMCSKKASSTSS